MTLVRRLAPYVRAARARGAAVPEPARCALCAASVGEEHRHVADLDARALLCACRACALLFLERSAARGRYRTIPERVLSEEGFALSEEDWQALEVPVRLAFFFRNSRRERWIAVLPGAAGATELELEDAAWLRVAARSRLASRAEEDVEALLAWAPRGGVAHWLLAPIDACYALAGEVRRHWRGFDGGDDVRRALASSFDTLRRRSRPA